MTKIALLHNGHELHFPDDISDEEMDGHVQGHLARIASEKDDQEARHKAASLDVHKQGHLMAREDTNTLLATVMPVMEAIAVNLAEIAKTMEAMAPVLNKIANKK